MAISTIVLLVLAAAFVVVLLWFMGMYNGLVRRRVDCDNGWSQIDVQLRRRYDLIPNLVETVKGYAAHEKSTLQAVIDARARAVAVTGDARHALDKAQAENVLTQALSRLIALAEAYPDLKANQNFARLQEELASTENRIGFSRQHYNDTVARYEQYRQTFPPNLVAAAFDFAQRQYFREEDGVAREAPKVSFS
jgi:LemA protein